MTDNTTADKPEDLKIEHEEEKPVAWLVHGGRTFRDRVFIECSAARKSAGERNDGAQVSPLYLRAAHAKEGKV